jgi:hypothetical protein
MSIKRYNQFVKGKINEEFQMAEPAPAKPATKPDIKEEPGTKPDKKGKPTPFRKDRSSPVPAPAKALKDDDMIGMEEEEVESMYKGTEMMQDLASQLGTKITEDGINYQGKKINFYSEDEKFHIGNKKFNTVEEVVNYLGMNDNEKGIDEDEIDYHHNFIPSESPNTLESKSYRNKRLRK